MVFACVNDDATAPIADSKTPISTAATDAVIGCIRAGLVDGIIRRSKKVGAQFVQMGDMVEKNRELLQL